MVTVTREGPPEVTIAAASPVTEGPPATFDVRSATAALEALTVAVSVTESGSMLAGVPPASDTFAVSLLGQGVAIGGVSTLLGHSSVQTTERYYAPWDSLRRIVREANSADPLLAGIDP